MTEEDLERLATHHHQILAMLIDASGALDRVDLSYAAEILGRTADSPMVRRTLMPLLDHQDAIVREGAIYGLTRHLDDFVREELRRLANGDASWVVRAAAAEALDDP